MSTKIETQNVTFRVPRTLMLKAKQRAAERGTTVTDMVIEGLVRLTSGNDAYAAARQRQLDLMNAGWILREEGEALPERATLHEC